MLPANRLIRWLFTMFQFLKIRRQTDRREVWRIERNVNIEIENGSSLFAGKKCNPEISILHTTL